MADQSTIGRRIAAATAIATAIAIPAEGLRQFAYYDPPSILTVCYGHTGRDIERGRKYSMAECQALLSDDMRKAVSFVEACNPSLPSEVLAAFSDAVYNMGPTIACDRTASSAARYLHAGRLIDACNQLPRWNRSRIGGQLVELPGLTTRRLAEQAICLKGIS